MNKKLDTEKKVEMALDIVRAVYGINAEKYKVIGRKLLIASEAKEPEYTMIFDIPSILANIKKNYSSFYIPKCRYTHEPFAEVCLAYLEKYNEETVRKNYAKEKKIESLKKKDFGPYREGGIYCTSYGYDETHYSYYICNKIVGQTIYLQALGKITRDLPGCNGQYWETKPDIKSKRGKEFTRRIVFVNNYYKQDWQVTVDRDVLSPIDPEEWACETSPYGGR